jgi:hypothetical protein
VSVLQWLDDRKSRVVSAQATHSRGSSEVGGGIHEERYAPQRVLSESEFELQHAGSASEEAALEEKAQAGFFGWPVESAVKKSLTQHDATCGLAVVLPGGRRIEVHPDFDRNTFERLVSSLEQM